MLPSILNKDLKSLKRSELQKLAKQHGVKANIKNDCIISALQEISDSGKENRNISVNKKTPVKVESANSSLGLENDLMSIQPPWNNSDLICLDSTPEQDTSIDEVSPENKSSNAQKRTRSSSRNRTPKGSTGQVKNVAASKTFSVEQSRTIAKTSNLKSSDKKQKNLKRRSSDSDVTTQTKKLRRISSSSRKENNLKNKAKIDEELQKEIMNEIRKKIEATGEQDNRRGGDDKFTSKIPRFTASGVTIGNSSSITPGNKDWNKLHHKSFNKLESIDDYERRKKERAERLLGSNKKNFGAISKLAQPVKRTGPKLVKPVIRKGRPKPTFISPVAGRTSKTPRSIMKDTKSDRKFTQQKTPKAGNTSVFKPTVTSTKKMNLNFAQKSAKASTPKRVTIVSDQGDKKQTYIKTPAVASRAKSFLTPLIKRKSVLVTPVALRATTSFTTPGSTKKNAFDIKESLKKPLTWIPHKGPLQPFDDAAKKTKFQDRIKDIKMPNVGTRDKRKQKMVAQKKQAKDKRMLLRRGIK